MFRRHRGLGTERVEGFRNHIAIEWSLKGVSGRDAAFCSAVSGAA